MIRVIVSDLGKVLLPFEIERAWEAVSPHFGLGAEAARTAFRALHGESGFGCGKCDGPAFFGQLVERTGLKLPYEAFCDAYSDMFWEDDAVRQLIAEAPVESRYLLSNTNDIHWQFIRKRYPHVLAPFDHLLVSHELGLEKPDAAIYEWVIRHSGRLPEEHLFIDDIAVNVEAAQAVGMDGIVHIDAENLRREFAARGLATVS